jgi:hypothetical protein
LYPNPNDGKCSLSLSSENGNELLVEISDLPGRTVYSNKIKMKPLETNEMSIDLSSVAKGIYMLQISNTKGKTSKKIIVF